MKKKAFILGISLIFNLSLAQECKYYKVKSGETLEKISKNYGVSVQEILKANRNIKPNNLKVGENLCIPSSRAKGSGDRDYAIYRVKRGDTLESIAKKFQVSVEELRSFNNLKTTKLKEGQELKIPTKTTAKRTEKQVSGYQTYIVQKGARLEHVAKKLGVSEKELERLNPELKGKWLEKGTVVKVPPTSNKKEAETTKYDIYTVRKGGRLEHVAKNLGIPLKDLERLNPELKGKWLSEGTKVKIPQKAKDEKIGKPEHVAKKLETSEKELERLNPELKSRLLKKDTMVKIPAEQKTQQAQAPREEIRPSPRPSRETEDTTLNRQASIPTETKLSRNSLPLPVEGEIVRNNKGVSIKARCGTPVRVVEEGRVIYSGGDLQAYGNMVIVDHGDFISLYAYNQKNLVKRGDRVFKNQEIALVGSKGDSGECILYFELRNKEGVPIDPTEYLKNTQ